MNRTAESITRQSKSNLAYSFISLEKSRREDMNVFYAFCRLVDDIADDPEQAPEAKQRALDEWKRQIEGPQAGEHPLAAGVRDLVGKYEVDRGLLLEILAGMEMDLSIRRYETFADLRQYCYRVASAVGLVSIEIFGYQHASCKEYAVSLGLALQTTNILRDVGRDWREDQRIYLPLEEMERFGYSPQTDLPHEVHNEAFLELMNFQADRSEGFYQSAAAHLHPDDEKSMVAAQIMSRIYHRVLEKMRGDQFRVFDREYRVNKAGKLWIALRERVGL